MNQKGTQNLSQDFSLRQQYWWNIFQQFDFNIFNRKGKENTEADALSRRVDLEFKLLLKNLCPIQK